MARKDKWVRRWKVESDNGNGTYTVAVDKDDNWGCSCRAWTRTFPRKDCKHIRRVKTSNPSPMATVTATEKPTCIPANVPAPVYDSEKNVIYYPLVPITPFDIHMEATIDFFMWEHGWGWGEIQERRHLPAEWTLAKVRAYIETHGRKTYADCPAW